MLLRRLLIVVVVLCAAPLSAAPRTILILGDSLSAGFGIDLEQGWVALLQKRLERSGRDDRVVNASISGDTTAGGHARLPQLLQRHKPAIVVIELGGNDGLRGLPLGQMRDNLAAMIQRARAARAQVLLVGIRLPPNYGPDYTRKFQAIYHELAAHERVALAPFLLEGVVEAGLMQEDGIHPQASAQSRMLDNIWPHLQRLLK